MSRVKNIQKLLHENDLFGCILQKKEDLFFLTGCHISTGLIFITVDEVSLFVDGRYYEQVKEACPSFHTHLLPTLSEICSHISFQKEKIAFDPSSTTYSSYQHLKKACHTLIENEPFFRLLRRKKDEKEIHTLEQAASLCEEGFFFLLKELKKGISEKELSNKLKLFWLHQAGEMPSFEPIIAFGKNSAFPHWTSSLTTLEPHDVVLIDIGVSYNFYQSDMTRVAFFKDPDPELLKCHMIVQEAYERAMKAVKPGILPHDVDAVARAYIESEGYGNAFCHGLGHGVGLEIHEPPRLNQKIINECHFHDHDVFTIEPGIYLPGKGGIRLENTLVLDHGKARSFMKSPLSPYFV